MFGWLKRWFYPEPAGPHPREVIKQLKRPVEPPPPDDTSLHPATEQWLRSGGLEKEMRIPQLKEKKEQPVSEPATNSVLNWIMTDDDSISIITPKKQYIIKRTHQNYEKVVVALDKGDMEEIEKLVNVQKPIQEFVTATVGDNSGVVVKNGTIYYNGEILDDNITQRTKRLMDAGLKFDKMIHFLKRVCNNPSYNSRRQLFKFLDHFQLPITEDGYFLAYKAVRKNWTDKHSGKIRSMPGDKPWMPRNEVDDDPANDCSAGFHAGTIEFVRGFANDDDHIIVVKIDPADVVSVPKSDTNKLRCHCYEALFEFQGELREEVYQGNGTPLAAGELCALDDDDDDYEDDECSGDDSGDNSSDDYDHDGYGDGYQDKNNDSNY